MQALELCAVRSAALDAARRAFGTDEDLLFVQLPFERTEPRLGDLCTTAEGGLCAL